MSRRSLFTRDGMLRNAHLISALQAGHEGVHALTETTASGVTVGSRLVRALANASGSITELRARRCEKSRRLRR